MPEESAAEGAPPSRRDRVLQTVRLGGSWASTAAAGGGTLGGTARVIAERAASEHIERGAQAAAARLAARRLPPAPEQRLVGPVFWAVMSAAFLKDVLDVLVNLTVLLSFIVIIFGFGLTFIILGYYYYSQVSLDTRTIVTVALGILVEVLPLLSIIPVATMSLLLVRLFERKNFMEKLKKHEAIVGRLEQALTAYQTAASHAG